MLVSFAVYMLVQAPVSAVEVCKFSYKGQPEKYNNDTMVVPDEMVAMSEYLYVPGTTNMSNDTLYQPSIMFIIDHSGSMVGSNGADPEAARFKVPSTLLDTLMKKCPLAEVGVLIFAGKLEYWRGTDPPADPLTDDDPYNTACPGEAGGYCPLYQLNKTYQGKTGYQIIKSYLALNGDYPAYKSNWNLIGTNINCGMNASKHAFTNTQRAKDRHFNIFFSDGGANAPTTNPTAYVAGTTVATTFTVYFETSTSPVPQQLFDFTNNVKKNGYSANNPKTDIWSIKNVGYDTLLSFVMKNVLNNILKEGYIIPFQMSVNGGTIINNWTNDSTGFLFPQLFPLMGRNTDFSFTLKYHTQRIYVNQQTGKIDTITKDTTHTVAFDVEIDPNQGALPDSLWDVKCWDRTLAFYFNNAPVTTIEQTMSPLQLRFNYTPGAANYNYSKATIEISNTSATGRDRETITLTKSGNTFTGTFPRVLIADGAAPAVGDGTLQHYRNDNLTAVFRNNETPKLPLDTLKIQAGFSFAGAINLVRGFYFDKNAEGYVDSIFVEATTDIPGGLTNAHVQEIVDKALTLPSFRGFTVNSRGLATGGFFIKVTENNAHTPVTYITADDKLVTTQTILTTGGEVKAGAWPVYDRVAPIIHWAPRSALLRDYKVASKSDTLGVKFSEPVKAVSSNEPFYFLSRANNANYVVTLSAAGHPQPDSLVFHVASVAGTMQDGDSLWIHETNRIADDTAGNFQNNTANIKRRLYVDVLYGPITIECGYYYDNNADGYVDSIYVKAATEIEGGLTNAHVAEIVQKAITLPAFRSFSVNSSGVVTGGFFIRVTEDKGHNPYTYITNDDKLIVITYTLSMGGEVSGGTLPMYDRVAPLIHWEAKAAYLIDYMDPAKTDTLFIKFSEPVNRVTSTEPFYFLDLDNHANYTVNLADAGQPEAAKMVFRVTSFSDVDYMEDGDTVWIKEIDRVCDDQGNFQNNNANTRRRLYVKRIALPYELIPQAVSPVSYQSITAYRVPAEITAVIGSELPNLNLQKNPAGEYCGMIIMVVPDPEDIGKFIPDLAVKGTMTILDAVGNTLVLKQPLSFWDQRKSLVTVWNLKNRNGRVVGPGMYVCLFEIEDITETLGYQNNPQKQVKKITIGVK